jgi:transcriptional regulator with XRE-family HTH domain
MSREKHGQEDPDQKRNRLHTGAQLHAWRLRHGLSAKALGQLIDVTERSIHRAERSKTLGAKVKLGMQLLQARISHGEITLPAAIEADLQAIEKQKSIVMEPPARYGMDWHGQLRTGADLRAWRESVGLYQKELANLLGVAAPSVRRAEQSASPSVLFLYGIELLRSKVLAGEIDLRTVTQGRAHRGRPKKD